MFPVLPVVSVVMLNGKRMLVFIGEEGVVELTDDENGFDGIGVDAYEELRQSVGQQSHNYPEEQPVGDVAIGRYYLNKQVAQQNAPNDEEERGDSIENLSEGRGTVWRLEMIFHLWFFQWIS